MLIQKKSRSLNIALKLSRLIFLFFLRKLDGIVPQYMDLYTIYLKLIGVKVLGKPRYICSDLKIDSSNFGIISISSDVVISSEVRILTHDYSVSDSIRSITIEGTGEVRKIERVAIESGAFIGLRCTIMPGVVIGEGAIVGACSVVTKDVRPFTVVAGNPAKEICTREEYNQKVISKYNSNPEVFYQN